MKSTMEPPPATGAALPRGGRAQGRTRAYLVLFALVVASRAASTVWYLEDTDSVRFAAAVRDYDVGELRPHFPGYPVFVALAKALAALTGSYALAFSLIGALATCAIVVHLQRLLRVRPEERLGLAVAALVFCNPMVWLLGNRYMPDLLGAACALAAVVHLLGGRRDLGFVLAGLLPGIRLSYVPFVLPAVLVALRARAPRGISLGAAAVAVWLVPLIADTGWTELVAAAGRQAEGHFTEFGGTIETEPDLGSRALAILAGVWAHGLGGWWPLRNPLTMVAGAGVVVAGGLGLKAARAAIPGTALGVLGACGGVYLGWIFLYQNVIHKTRHVLPLVLLLLVPLAFGMHELVRRGGMGRAAATLFLSAYAAVTVVLVVQHRRPTAIAQVAAELRARADGNLHVVSIPLANFYLASAGVNARFLDMADSSALRSIPATARVVVVGGGAAAPGTRSAARYYHNPFVNPMWPEVVVHERVVPGRPPE